MIMLEKAAKSAWDENRKRCAKHGLELPEWEDDRPALREDWMAFARAVLLAVREVDEGVEEAGMEAPDHPTYYDDTWRDAKNPAGYFAAMIDAILEQDTQP